MADIKTRDVTRGTIKTLDRTASSMNRVKEQAIRSRAFEASGERDDRRPDAYAQDELELNSRSAADHAVRAGAEIIQRSRSSGKAGNDEIAEKFHQNGLAETLTGDIRVQNAENFQRLARDQGIKTMQARRMKGRMTDAESIQNAEIFQRNAPQRADLPLNTIRNDENIQQLRRDHAASAASGFVRYIWEHARSYILTVGGGTIAAVIIVTMLVFFGIGTITFSNNSPDTVIDEAGEEAEYFIPDLAGSPTRYAIVRAAAREIGNAGGYKFWKWYGFNSHVHWCACFTSYIAAECGCIQSGICPRSALVDDWVSFYKKQHRWAPGSYIPHSGDFIIFDWDLNGSPNHIGIVESCDGKTIHTIEGNSGDVCKRKTYTRGSVFIMGYCLPNYSGSGT